MPFGNREKKKIYVGYDLGEETCQISFFMPGMDEPGTASTIADSEIFEIPTVLAKRKGVNQWYYGNEAVRLSSDPGFFPVDSLLSKACEGGNTLVDGNEYDSLSLLTLYIKRSLSVLSFFCSTNDITELRITTASMNGETVDMLRSAADGLGLRDTRISFEDHAESFFHYLMHSGADFRSGGQQAFSLAGDTLRSCLLSCSGNTKPLVVTSDERTYKGFSDGPGLDRDFLDCLENGAMGDDVAEVYISGSVFSRNGIDRSLRYILNGRKAYEGSNLFSKGAVYSVMDKASGDVSDDEIIFLGKDKLRSNVGIRAMDRGEEIYHPLMDAGTNWYEAGSELTFVLTGDRSIPLYITPISGEKPYVELLPLKNVPERPEGTLRLHMVMKMTDVKTLKAVVRDPGFGQIYPETGLSWEFTVILG